MRHRTCTNWAIRYHLNKVSSTLPTMCALLPLSDISNSTLAFTLTCLAEQVENGRKTMKIADFDDVLLARTVGPIVSSSSSPKI
uniref:Uncharacterized protein n=1 Tax=Romanomermis culicivorax TaxID=13658 RepID=A0A915J2P0_ROMCU